MNVGLLTSLALLGTGAYFAYAASRAFPAAYAGGAGGTDAEKREFYRDGALALGAISAGAIVLTLTAPSYRHYGARGYWEGAT